ncbi:MAG: TonB-dependent siderophore receptor [Paucibacter sp.]|nr:TonB-dependent siderophore receptor [Roseateles sp.]
MSSKNFRTALLPLGALAAGFGLASVAHAQATAPAAVEDALPIVRTKASAEKAGKDDYQATDTRIGKGKQELRDIPQSVTVVTERLIDDRNLDTLKDVLKNTAGITFMAAEGGEEDIRLRGFALQSTGDVFVDGLRDPAFYDRDTFFLDRVELLRGSASMLFGRGSTGGAVNLVTKVPRLLDENQIDVTVAGGSYGRVVGDFNVKTGESSAVRFGMMVTKADNNGAGSSLDKAGVAATFRTGIGEIDEFSASIYHLDNNNGMNYGMPWILPKPGAPVDQTTLLPVAPDAYYGMASDRNKGTADQLTLSHTHRFNLSTELVTRVRSGNFSRDQRSGTVRVAAASLQPGGAAVTGANFSGATVLTRGTHLKMQDMQTLHAQSDLSSKFQALGLRHEVQAGIDFAQEEKQVYNDSPNLTGAQRSAFYAALGLTKPNTKAGTPNDGAWINEGLRQQLTTSEYRSKAAGAYAQDLLQITEHWKLLAGLRYDYLRGDYDTFSYTYSGGAGTHGYDKFAKTGTSSYRMKVSEWSKRLGLLFQPNERMSFHASAASSFNTSGDAYSLGATNQDTPPEQSVNLELGAKIESSDGQLSSRFAIFQTTKRHERNTDPLVNLVTLSGKRHAAGFEADFTGRILPGWEVFGSYMWMPIAKIDIAAPGPGIEAQGSRPSLSPRHTGTLWSTYQLTAALRVGAGLNARSAQTPNRHPGWSAPAFVTGDLMAEYAVLPGKFTLKANLSNVTDKLYADSIYTGHYVPGAGRTLAVTGSLKF